MFADLRPPPFFFFVSFFPLARASSPPPHFFFFFLFFLFRIMEKVTQEGPEFVHKETERVKNLLNGKLSDAKKAMLNMRLNILSSFNKLRGSKTEL